MPVYLEQNSVILLHCASVVKMPARIVCALEHHHVRHHCQWSNAMVLAVFLCCDHRLVESLLPV